MSRLLLVLLLKVDVFAICVFQVILPLMFTNIHLVFSLILFTSNKKNPLIATKEINSSVPSMLLQILCISYFCSPRSQAAYYCSPRSHASLSFAPPGPMHLFLLLLQILCISYFCSSRPHASLTFALQILCIAYFCPSRSYTYFCSAKWNHFCITEQ